MEIIKDKNEIKYLEAKKRVKKLKGFYIHLTIYILVNLFLIFLNLEDIRKEDTFWTWEIWATPVFWGIGLLAHGLSTFLPGYFLGENWEERKTKELMEKYK